MNRSLPFRIKFTGEAGEGVVTIGEILLEAIVRQGWYGSVYKNFPSSIRSGQSEVIVSFSEEKIVSPIDSVDALFILNLQAFGTQYHELKYGGIVFGDSQILHHEQYPELIEHIKANNLKVINIPLNAMCSEFCGSETGKSAVVLGIVSWILELPFPIVETLLCQKLRPKGDLIVELNRSVLTDAYRSVGDIPDIKKNFVVANRRLLQERVFILDGNQALSLAALHAGCQFFACYPITPATTIGDYLAEYLPQSGGVFYQAEDEIAAIGAVAGASFTGTKAMTATSGPGLSLMQEFISYISMVELPAVIVDVQRIGPSTGMPTKFGQDDLLAAVFGGHGEDQRIVLSPVSVEDCLYTTVTAFNLAEKYRCPVILLSDSLLASSKETLSCPDLSHMEIIERSGFPGYGQKSGISSELDSGSHGFRGYHLTGLEHTMDNVPVENPYLRSEQICRRFQKISAVETENDYLVMWDLEQSGVNKTDLAVVAWGFTATVVREAIRKIRAEGLTVAACYPRLLYPVCTNAIKQLACYNSHVIIAEANYTGQFSKLLKMYIDTDFVVVTRSDGESFSPGELEKKLIELAGLK